MLVKPCAGKSRFIFVRRRNGALVVALSDYYETLYIRETKIKLIFSRFS